MPLIGINAIYIKNITMKQNINEEIKRINELMGVSRTPIISESIVVPVVGREVAERLIGKNMDELADILRRGLGFADDKIDDVIAVSRKLKAGDDIGELGAKVIDDLAAHQIDDMAGFVRVLMRNGSLGPIENLGKPILTRLDSLESIAQSQVDDVMAIYRNGLDDIPFLENSPEIKNELAIQFEKEINEKYSYKIVGGTKAGSTAADDVAGSLYDNMLAAAKKENPEIFDEIPKEVIEQRMKLIKSQKGVRDKYTEWDIELLEKMRNGKLNRQLTSQEIQRLEEYVADLAQVAKKKGEKSWFNPAYHFEKLAKAETGWQITAALGGLGAYIGFPISIPIFINVWGPAFKDNWEKTWDKAMGNVLGDGFTGDWKETFIKWYAETYPQDNIDENFYLENQGLIRVEGEDPNYTVYVYATDGRTVLSTLETDNNGNDFVKIVD